MPSSSFVRSQERREERTTIKDEGPDHDFVPSSLFDFSLSTLLDRFLLPEGVIARFPTAGKPLAPLLEKLL